MMIDTLAYLLLIISSALLYPVMILLAVLTLVSLVFVGELLAEYSTRRREMDIAGNNPLKGNTWLINRFKRDVEKIKDKTMMEARLEKLLQEYEFDVEKRLEPLALSAKLAPMLGLMGTLIPLGPALIGLTTGDINVLAKNLTIAFTTTVVGLFIAGISYVTLSLRRRWYAEDLSDIAFYAEILAGGSGVEER